MNKQNTVVSKHPIIVATSIYSAGGQYTEAAIQSQGIDAFCLMNCIFDTNPEDNRQRFDRWVKEKEPDAIIMDNHWTALGITAIPKGLIEFADKMHNEGVEVFCVNRRESSGFGCELWRFHKPLKFRDMNDPVCHLARIGIFGSIDYSVSDGSPINFGAGDGGIEDRSHSRRSHLSFQERDWPAIFQTVRNELQS